jgi:hypothetical protein
MPLLVHGIEAGANGATVLGTLERAKATRDFQFHRGHANGTLTQIVREWQAQIGHETQYRVGVLVQGDEVERQGLGDPAKEWAEASFDFK